MSHNEEEDYRLFMQNIKGVLALAFDEELIPLFIEGAIEEITGYDKGNFLSRRIKWTDIIIPQDLLLFLRSIQKMKSNSSANADIEYRIKRKDGKIIWIGNYIHFLPGKSKAQGRFQGFIRDINGRKKFEENVEKAEKAHLKEIHHRVKNNLQIISSLLSLQAEKFKDEKFLEAFSESQSRIISMALIHEELYRSTDMDTLDFSEYLNRLTEYLLNTYNVKNENIILKLNIEKVTLGMDTAIPLGIIVNELVSNAIKHAFPGEANGKIIINLCRREDYEQHLEKSRNLRLDMQCINKTNLEYILVISDNGKGLPEYIDLECVDSLGLQLVHILVEQIDGCIEIERNNGTKFTIWFSDAEK
jgi:two-component system, sensor histidine kinase PdtaS